MKTFKKDDINACLVDNNVLLISQVKNKVFLPYKIENVNKLLEQNKNKSVLEIIEENYVVPLSNFRWSIISRFRETFKLVKKQGYSFFDAVDLASELMFKRYLHPAIIASCENLDQLDIYLDCLEENQLNDFPFFKVEHELKVKQKN